MVGHFSEALYHKLGNEFESACVYCKLDGNDVCRGEGLHLIEREQTRLLVEGIELCQILEYYIC